MRYDTGAHDAADLTATIKAEIRAAMTPGPQPSSSVEAASVWLLCGGLAASVVLLGLLALR